MFLGYEKTKMMRAFCKHESSAVKEMENTGRIQTNKTHAFGLVSSFFYWWLGVKTDYLAISDLIPCISNG